MAMRRICIAGGCDDLALPGLSHCEVHEAARQARLKAKRAGAKLGEAAQAGIALYRTKAWRDASKAWLAAHPCCAECERAGVVTPAVEVDHIEPHRGDRRLFWDPRNRQGLCRPCHSRKTAREVFHGWRAEPCATDIGGAGGVGRKP